MKLNMAVLAVVIGTMLNVPSALAEADATAFLEDYDHADLSKRQLWEQLINQTGIGLYWANVELTETRKEKPLYCPPKALAINGSQDVDIMRAFIKKDSDNGKYPFGLVLMEALKDTFPCDAR